MQESLGLCGGTTDWTFTSIPGLSINSRSGLPPCPLPVEAKWLDPTGTALNRTLARHVLLEYCSARPKEISMFLGLFVILLVMWMLGFFAFHVAGGLIHLLLIIAVISLVVHLIRGRSVA